MAAVSEPAATTPPRAAAERPRSPSKRSSLVGALLRPLGLSSSGGSPVRRVRVPYTDKQLERARRQVAQLKAYGPPAKPITGARLPSSPSRPQPQAEEPQAEGAYSPPVFMANGSVSPVLGQQQQQQQQPHTDSDAEASAIPGELFTLTREGRSGGFGFNLLASAAADGIRVYSVTAGGSAERAGVAVDSVVTEINARDVRGLGYADIIQLIADSQLTLHVRLKHPNHGQQQQQEAKPKHKAPNEAPVITLTGAVKGLITRRKSSKSPDAKGTNGKHAASGKPKKSSFSRLGSRKSPQTAASSSRSSSQSTRPAKINYLRSGRPSASKRGKKYAALSDTGPTTSSDLSPTSTTESTPMQSPFVPRDAAADDDDSAVASEELDTRNIDDDALLRDTEPNEPLAAELTDTPLIDGAARGKSTVTKSGWDKAMHGVYKDGGVQLKLVGSKVHAKRMGVYSELEQQYNRAPVFQRDFPDDTTFFLYYKDKSWMLSPAVGRTKCIVCTTSPAMRPDRVKSIWYEARGPSKSAMQGHPSIKALLIDDGAECGGVQPTGAGVRRRLRLA